MTRSDGHVRGPKGSRREGELLSASARLFSINGFERTTIQDIADSLEMTKGSLYYYVASKEELLFLVVLRTHKELMANVVDSVDYYGFTPLDAVIEFVCRHIEFVRDNRDSAGLFRAESHVIRAEDMWWKALSAVRHEYSGRLTQLITRAQESGEVTSELDAALTARSLLSMANATRGWPDADEASGSAVIEHHAKLIKRALRSAE